jgi:hypothetical protein
MAAKLVLVVLCTIALSGCAQCEDCPGSVPGTAFTTDSQRTGASNGPDSRYVAAPKRDADEGPNRQASDKARWCDYVYE